MDHRKVVARLPGKWSSNCHGARPVLLIITMIKWFRTSRLSIKNSLSHVGALEQLGLADKLQDLAVKVDEEARRRGVPDDQRRLIVKIIVKIKN